MSVRFWCSAQFGVPWTWRWQPYVGVWLLVIGSALWYGWAVSRLEPKRFANDEHPVTRREVTLFALGLLLLWAGADWPLGALGAGYLLSVKTLQYLMFAYVAPGLILQGLPRWLLRRMIRSRVAFRVARAFTRPLLPLLVFNGVLVMTHLPPVVDGAAGNQLASFALDMTWIASGFVLWWPALGRLPELAPMSDPLRIGYLLLNIFMPTVPASFFTFSRYPIYSVYELAPRVGGIPAVTDQRVAGLLMKIGGGFILFGVMSVMFFRWYRREGRPEEVAVRPVSADAPPDS